MEGYRSLWIALAEIDEANGGMVLAPGCHKHGSLHDERFVVPHGAVPADAWRREDYRPGDVIVIHGFTPHGGMPNRSQRIRYSVDARIQSAANPAVLEGELTEVSRRQVTLDCGYRGPIRLGFTERTLLRFGYSGTPLTVEEFVQRIKPGLRIMATRDGDLALMLRHSSGE